MNHGKAQRILTEQIITKLRKAEVLLRHAKLLGSANRPNTAGGKNMGQDCQPGQAAQRTGERERQWENY